MSTILYSCESWLEGNLRPIEKLYNSGIKQLLRVRMTTYTNVCYVELGSPPLKSLVLSRQRKCFQRLWEERRGMPYDPWVHAVKLTLATNTLTSKHIHSLINNYVDDVTVGIESLKQSIASSTSSRRQSYVIMNHNLSVHSIYKCHDKTDEIYRIAFSRLRVIGHNLTIETGHWNRLRRGRLEVAERLCPCGDVQTELHVLESCPLTQDIRTTHNLESVDQ